MNAAYGKCPQTAGGKLGILFNPVYGAYICALTRIHIVKVGLNFFERIDEIATDAVMGEIDPEMPLPVQKQLGGLEIKNRLFSVINGDQVQSVVILQTGLTADLDGNILRARGHPVKKSEKSSARNKRYIFLRNKLKISGKCPRHSKEALIQNKPEEIHQFRYYEKDFVYNDAKRIWLNPRIKNMYFSTTITSKPLNDDPPEEADSDLSPKNEKSAL